MSSDNSTVVSNARRTNIQAFLMANAHLLDLKGEAYKHIVATELKEGPGQLTTKALALNGAETYFNATPAQMSSIVPQLRLFLVQGGGKKDVEIHFNGKTTFDMYNRGSNDYTKQRPTTTTIFREQSENIAAGLKNFSISINDRYGLRAITGKMQLFFRSPGDLVKGPYREFVEIIKRGGGSLETAEGRQSEIKKLQDQIKAIESFLENRDKKDQSAKYFSAKAPAPPSLKAVLGWSSPKQSGASPDAPDDPKSKKLYKFLESNRVTFILNVSKHTIGFGDQGELTLDMDLNGHVDDVGGGSEEADIFKNTYEVFNSKQATTARRFERGYSSTNLKLTTTPIKTRISSATLFGTSDPAAILEKLKDYPDSGYLKKFKNKVNEKLKKVYVPPSPDTEDDEASINSTIPALSFDIDIEEIRLERELATLKKKVATVLARDESSKSKEGIKDADQYLRKITNLYSRCQKDLIRIKHKNFFEALEADGKIKQVEISEEVLGNLEANPDGKLYQPIRATRRDITQPSPSNSGEVQSRIFARFDAQQRGQAQTLNKSNNIFLEGSKQVQRGSQSRRIVHFIRLGDIVDVAFHNTDLAISNRTGKASYRVVFDSIKLAAGNSAKTYCLADIPIYLNHFHAFFYNKLIKAQVKSMTLMDFLERLLEYIGGGLTIALTETKANQEYVPNVVPISRASKAFKLDPQRRYKDFSLNATSAAYLENQIADAEDHNKLLFVTMRGIEIGREADVKKDSQIGINHIVVGANKGPLIKVAFSEQNNPYIKTMNVQEGSSQFPIVKQNANLTLMGCPIFYQSQTIYIDADFALMGAGRDLGIGGYYAIASVDHNFDGVNFTTELKCYWISDSVTGRPRRRRRNN